MNVDHNEMISSIAVVLVASSGLTVTPSVHTNWLKEAEKKHGRVAILSIPALIAISGSNHGIDPVPWLNSQPVDTQLFFYSTAGVFEAFNLRRFGKGFTLKEGEVPGKLFNVTARPNLELVENVVGRAAMVISAGILFTSLTTNG